MNTKRIIVGLDVEHGSVVKCVRFLEPTLVGDPAKLGVNYEADGADELIYLDISASLESRSIQIDWIRRTAESLFIPFSVVGGVRTIDDFRQILLAGADKVGVNTGAFENPELIRQASETYGSQCVVLTLDSRKTLSVGDGLFDWEVYTHSGRRATGVRALEWAEKAQSLGAGEIVYTCIDKDGTQEGYDLELTAALARTLSIPVVASGGAGSVDHIKRAFSEASADAALVASLVHYNLVSIQEIKAGLQEEGIPVRNG